MPPVISLNLKFVQ